MALMEWSKDLSLDVQNMDDQHKILLGLMNRLYDDHQRGANYFALKDTFEELADMTTTHFKEEEEYMDSIGFPGLATHKVIHEELLKKFATHQEQFNKEQKLNDEFFVFLKFWLRSHIMGIDTKYANHSKQNVA